MRISLRIAGVVTALAAIGGLASACDWPASALHNVTIRDAASGVTGIPASIPAGQYQFNIVSSVPEGQIQVARIGSDYSVAQTLKDVAAAFGPHSAASAVATKRLYARTAFVGGRTGSGSYSTYLLPGDYFAIDTNTMKLERFTVSPAAVAPHYPRSTLNIAGGMSMPNGMDHFMWNVTGAFRKSGVIKFATVTGDEPHFLEIDYIHPGKTATDCINYQGNGAGAPCDPLVDTGIVSTYQAMTLPYNFPHGGNYLVVCYMPDDDSGVPHALLGMTSVISLH